MAKGSATINALTRAINNLGTARVQLDEAIITKPNHSLTELYELRQRIQSELRNISGDLRRIIDEVENATR